MNCMDLLKDKLCDILLQIDNAENLPKPENIDYEKRTTLVYEALSLASRLGYQCGIRKLKDSEDTGWPVVVIKLPTGEVSWHCKATDLEYDGYNTCEKYNRIRKFVNL